MQRNPWSMLVIYHLHGMQISFIAAPLFWWMSVMVLGVYQRSLTGAWPRPMVDPVHFEARWLQFFSGYLILGSWVSIPVVLVLGLILWKVDPEIRQSRRIVALFAAWLLTFILIGVDPWDVVEWYFD